MTSNLIGIIFARSLHYQFYSWYAQQIPFLAWRTKQPVAIKYVYLTPSRCMLIADLHDRLALLAVIEYAWNVYPATNISSSVLLGANIILLRGIFFGYPEGMDSSQVQSDAEKVKAE